MSRHGSTYDKAVDTEAPAGAGEPNSAGEPRTSVYPGTSSQKRSRGQGAVFRDTSTSASEQQPTHNTTQLQRPRGKATIYH